MSGPSVHRTPVVHDHFYTIFLENYRNQANFIHIDVYSWNLSARKRIVEDCQSLIALHKVPIFALIEKDNTKLKKFAKLLGFELYNEPVDDKGVVRELYILQDRRVQ